MLLTLFTLTLVVISLQGLQVDFERFEMLLGVDYYNSTLRVRKYNRTVVTLNGTMELLQPLNKSIIVSTALFHSSRGNQQFNHYPVKFPTQDVCEFMNSVYTEYREHLKDVVNLVSENECPIAPRVIIAANDKVFPSHVVPRFFPSGLWKAQAIAWLNDIEVMRFEMIIKAKNDLI
ncbi:uncharacterized protein LOC126565512 [Anopheles maculipalpis]|uniref:uncharacterized protein LOC126565512 n=1 Tax=Anopheles maculipalpis TaxID=1496333 RepID=UPI002158E94D|nr:uncharacterized protein LOC126565512 [Anopheles maculipalpis]